MQSKGQGTLGGVMRVRKELANRTVHLATSPGVQPRTQICLGPAVVCCGHETCLLQLHS